MFPALSQNFVCRDLFGWLLEASMISLGIGISHHLFCDLIIKAMTDDLTQVVHR